MKIALLADIHSNHYALQACLDEIFADGGYYGIAFLGDYVSDCPYPQKTMRLLRDLPDSLRTWFVRGNREDYMLEHRHRLTEEWSYNSQSGSLLYTYENLSGEDLRFFESMPIGMEVKIDGCPPFSICHGTMSDNARLVLPDTDDVPKAMYEAATQLVACGHCHAPYIYSEKGRTIVNAGAVGNPVNGIARAQYADITLKGEEWVPQLHSAEYDAEAEIAEFYESGLFDKANVWSRAYIAALREAKNYTAECVRLVRQMSEESGKPFSCEDLWQQAAEIIGI